MKPFDTKGEYSPAEVKTALAGIDGTRQLSYRYERLDKNNNFIESIDYVQSCSIENNSLADIKRTAKMDILDTGSLNYLQDRIKPYIRLTMPKDVTYADAVKSFSPSVWWKMDDQVVTPAPNTSVTVADGNTFNTLATADLIDLTVNSGRKANIILGSGTLRSDYYTYLNVNAAQAVQIEIKNTGTEPVYYELYKTSSLTSDLTFLRGDYVVSGRDFRFGYPFPDTGLFVLRAFAQTTTAGKVDITVFKANRLEDSSGNQVYALGSNLSLRSAPAVLDGGYSWMTNNVYNSVVADATTVPLAGGLSINFWEKHSVNVNEFGSQWGTQSGYLNYYFSDDALPGTYVANFEFHSYDTSVRPNWNGTITVPAAVMSAGTHMVTLTADIASNTVKLYINANLVGTLIDPSTAQFSALGDMFVKEYLSYAVVGNYSWGALYFDDYSVFPRALAAGDIAAIYQKGLSATVIRSGYVEWPQGVFVLSSPKRTLVEGNYVHRDVEGYDQLVTLKEDSIDSRVSFPAGTKYTTAVAAIAAGSVAPASKALLPPVSVPINDKWIAGFPAQGGAPEYSGETGWGWYYLAPTTTTTSASMSYGSGYASSIFSKNVTAIIDGFSISAKVTPTTGQYTTINMTVSDLTFEGRDFFEIAYDNNIILARVGGKKGATFTAAYNATSHAWWKVEESKGVINFYTSSDGTTWNSFYSTPSVYRSGSKLVMTLDSEATHGGAGPFTASFTNVSVMAATGFGLNVTDSPSVMPTAMEWATGTTKLQIVNDLLGAINYTPAAYDEDGIFFSKPYITPDNRASEYTYATDAQSVIAGDVNQTIDLFKIPNKWIAVVSEADRPQLVSTYINYSPASPTSTASRGRTIVDFRTEQNAADQLTLDALTARLAFEASQVYEVIEFTTGIMPIHQNADVYNLSIDGLSVNNKYSEHKWSMPLENGGTMKHTVRRVVSL